MLKHPTKPPNAIQRSGKAAPVIPGPVMLATPSGIVHVRHCAPQLARRVRYYRKRAFVQPGVPMLRPRIDVWKVRIASIWLNKQRRYARDFACHALTPR